MCLYLLEELFDDLVIQRRVHPSLLSPRRLCSAVSIITTLSHHHLTGALYSESS